MKTLRMVQGSPEWHAHRAEHFNASDAPAMMGCSSYKTRSELIKELATGLSADIDVATQRRFDDGHKFEALARPLAEEIAGKELYPVTGSHGKYSASFDGLTLMQDVAFEHKTLNSTLREIMGPGCTGVDLPLQYRVQMEQQAMVSGAERILFMASKWSADDLPVEVLHCWYEPDAELRAQIIAGWEQLEKDVAAYVPTEAAAPVVAEPVESLPAVAVKLEGSLAVVSNLDKFGDALRGFIGRMVAKPGTDQEFADAEAECKALKKAEEMLEAAESGALAQISDVELLRRTVANLRNLARTTRLAREKLVAAEKDARRTALVTDAQQDLDQHVTALNQHLGSNWLPRVAGGFAESIKGKKSLSNMQDAVAVALTNAKLAVQTTANTLLLNRDHLRGDGAGQDWITLFPDFAAVGTKAPEDFQALAAHRIGQHQQAEAKRMEAERERIRAEEQAKAQAEVAEQERQRIQQQAQQEQAEIAQAAKAGELAAPVATDLAGLVQDKAAEAVAGIDAQKVIGEAKASAAAADAGECLSLGQINARLKESGVEVSISAATLDAHGIVYRKERGAVQVPVSQLRRLYLVLALGLQKMADECKAKEAA